MELVQRFQLGADGDDVDIMVTPGQLRSESQVTPGSAGGSFSWRVSRCSAKGEETGLVLLADVMADVVYAPGVEIRPAAAKQLRRCRSSWNALFIYSLAMTASRYLLPSALPPRSGVVSLQPVLH